MAKVYDCFAFFNELDLLELRLEELDSFVDCFVLVESTRTFQKKPKELIFEKNKERFKKYLPKIRHIVVDFFPGFFAKWRTPRPFDYDNHQKEQILLGLKDASPEDWIIVSDVDEIPNLHHVKDWKDRRIKVFQQRMSWFYLNNVIMDYPEPYEITPQGYKPWHGTVMLKSSDLTKKKTIKKTRLLREARTNTSEIEIILEGGWHFSYLGGISKVREKIQAYAHTEHNKNEFLSDEVLREVLANKRGLYGLDIKAQVMAIDSSFPQVLQKNPEKFKELIAP